jgi:hypothetical protein
VGEVRVGEEVAWEVSLMGEVGCWSLDESFVRFFLRKPKEGMRSGAEVACSAVWHCHLEKLSLCSFCVHDCTRSCELFLSDGALGVSRMQPQGSDSCEWPGLGLV